MSKEAEESVSKKVSLGVKVGVVAILAIILAVKSIHPINEQTQGIVVTLGKPTEIGRAHV